MLHSSSFRVATRFPYWKRLQTKLSRYASNNTKTSQQQKYLQDKNKTIALYATALVALVFGMSYAAVPLYKVFCQMTGFGGTAQRLTQEQTIKAIEVKPVKGAKVIKVDFACNVHSSMPWKFKPTQASIKIIPGETALAFYTVKNTKDYAITGVATYNVYPPQAAIYFNKIQCFCFEEQRLGPNEEIDMPVFFYLDPEILKDPATVNTTNITLAYTFFKTGDESEDETMKVLSKSDVNLHPALLTKKL
jgi:cytochrome c oxidase assembly protein subunit 11